MQRNIDQEFKDTIKAELYQRTDARIGVRCGYYDRVFTSTFGQTGKHIRNVFIESFNGRLRHECLNQHYFETLQEAKKIAENWRIEYNTFRLHGSLNGFIMICTV